MPPQERREEPDNIWSFHFVAKNISRKKNVK
jgi:hypothetical protein